MFIAKMIAKLNQQYLINLLLFFHKQSRIVQFRDYIRVYSEINVLHTTEKYYNKSFFKPGNLANYSANVKHRSEKSKIN